jgi:hypothetical protein
MNDSHLRPTHNGPAKAGPCVKKLLRKQPGRETEPASAFATPLTKDSKSSAGHPRHKNKHIPPVGLEPATSSLVKGALYPLSYGGTCATL